MAEHQGNSQGVDEAVEAPNQTPGVVDLSGAEAEYEAAIAEAAGEPEAQVETVAAAELEAAQAKIEELTKELETWKAQAYRRAADLENFRRRSQQTQDELRKFGIEGLLKAILPVADNLERATEHAGEDPVFDGVRMVVRQFNQVLGNYGASSFDALNQPFDPQVHEAMSQVESAEHEPNTVVQVFQKGWKLHDRLVRPAMVIVSKRPVAPAEEAEPEAAEAPEAEAAEAPEAEVIEAGAADVVEDQPAEGESERPADEA